MLAKIKKTGVYGDLFVDPLAVEAIESVAERADRATLQLNSGHRMAVAMSPAAAAVFLNNAQLEMMAAEHAAYREAVGGG